MNFVFVPSPRHICSRSAASSPRTSILHTTLYFATFQPPFLREILIVGRITDNPIANSRRVKAYLTAAAPEYVKVIICFRTVSMLQNIATPTAFHPADFVVFPFHRLTASKYIFHYFSEVDIRRSLKCCLVQHCCRFILKFLLNNEQTAGHNVFLHLNLVGKAP